jgi:RNA polymerase sigma factor (sigma-70 family)
MPRSFGSDTFTGALHRLPALDREVLTLTVWEGLSPEEVGRLLQVLAGTIRVRLHRARARLRRLLHTAVAADAAVISPAAERS